MKKSFITLMIILACGTALTTATSCRKSHKDPANTENPNAGNIEGHVKNAADKTGHAVKKAGKKTGKAVKHAADDVGDAVKKGADKVKEHTTGDDN